MKITKKARKPQKGRWPQRLPMQNSTLHSTATNIHLKLHPTTNHSYNPIIPQLHLKFVTEDIETPSINWATQMSTYRAAIPVRNVKYELFKILYFWCFTASFLHIHQVCDHPECFIQSEQSQDWNFIIKLLVWNFKVQDKSIPGKLILQNFGPKFFYYS